MKRSTAPFYSIRWLRHSSEQYTAAPFPASALEAGTKVPQAAQGRRISGTGGAVAERTAGDDGGCSAPEETAAFSLCMKFPTAIQRMYSRRARTKTRPIGHAAVRCFATASASRTTSGLLGCICWSFARGTLASSTFLRSKASTTTSLK